MKKIVSTLLVCVLLVGCIMTFASCSKVLTGKYEADWAIAEVTYEFGLFGKVTVTVEPLIGDTVSYEGKYEFNDAGDEITFTFENEEAEEYGGTVGFSSGEEDGVKYIKLAGIKYNKAD